MDETVQAVIAAIRANRATFEAFCYALSDEQLARAVPDSSWTVKDFASHLATLDPEMERLFEETAAGAGVEPSDERKAFDVDAFNDAVVAERRAWPLRQIFEEGAAQRERLITMLGRLDGADLEKPMYFSGDAKRGAGRIPLKLFLAGWAQHDPIHAADMIKALPELAGDVSLGAWLANPFVNGYQASMNRAPS